MKRFLALLLCSITAVFSFTGCSLGLNNLTKGDTKAAKSTSPETIVMRLAENQPSDYPTTLGDKEFARLVDERTEGRIKIEVYADGQLGDEISVTEQIEFAAIDFARISISSLAQLDKSVGVLMLPYIYRDKEHMFKVLEGPIGEKILDNLVKSTGIQGLAWLDAGTRNFYNTKHEIKSPEDMKDLKIRSQETALMMDLVKAFGATPVALAYEDIYSALQTGVIDGAENNWASFEAAKHYEVAKYYTIDEHIRIPELILVSQRVMNKLSTKDQAIVIQAAKEAAVFERKEWVEREEVSRKKVESAGVKITTLKTNAKFQEKVKSIYEKYGIEYKDMIADIINTQ